MVQYAKTGKYIPDYLSKIPNGRKFMYVDQMVMKNTASFIARPSKICPNWDFWFVNICHLAALHLSSIFVTKLQGIPYRVNEKNVPGLGGLVVL
jgi:hypothetical protein